jgi:hypothetical protein
MSNRRKIKSKAARCKRRNRILRRADVARTREDFR